MAKAKIKARDIREVIVEGFCEFIEKMQEQGIEPDYTAYLSMQTAGKIIGAERGEEKLCTAMTELSERYLPETMAQRRGETANKSTNKIKTDLLC